MTTMTEISLLSPTDGLSRQSTRHNVVWARREAHSFLSQAQPDFVKAFEVVEEQAQQALAATPADPDLREWQALAADLAVALRPHDTDLAERARQLAGRLRSSAARVARAPGLSLALRPTSRRVLEAILELGGGDCTLIAVRQHTGLGQTHISNVIRSLSAQGFITVASDTQDGRGRRLSVTSEGRGAIRYVEGLRRADGPFESQVRIVDVQGDFYDPGHLRRSDPSSGAAD